MLQHRSGARFSLTIPSNDPLCLVPGGFTPCIYPSVPLSSNPVTLHFERVLESVSNHMMILIRAQGHEAVFPANPSFSKLQRQLSHLPPPVPRLQRLQEAFGVSEGSSDVAGCSYQPQDQPFTPSLATPHPLPGLKVRCG